MYSTEFLDLPSLRAAAGTVTLPGSKSISNRVLLLAALCEGVTTIHDLLDSDDTRVMLVALKTLGCAITQDGATVQITGLGGKLGAQKATLFLGNAGTAMRPLTAALAVLGGDFELGGIPRMHERPIGDLSMRYANWVAASTTWATTAFRRCALAHRPSPWISPFRYAAMFPASS